MSVHTIVFVSPPQSERSEIECSCGWYLFVPNLNALSHQDRLRAIVALWLDHVDEARLDGAGR